MRKQKANIYLYKNMEYKRTSKAYFPYISLVSKQPRLLATLLQNNIHQTPLLRKKSSALAHWQKPKEQQTIN